MRKYLTVAAFAASLLAVAPAAGQADERSYELGQYWTISAIDVQDGHFEEYMTYLSGQWRDVQEFSRQQGWLLEYHILSNDYPRAGEPDLYLIARFTDMPTTAEIRRRDGILNAHLQRTPRQQDEAFGTRSAMRTPGSNWLMRELTFGNR